MPAIAPVRLPGPLRCTPRTVVEPPGPVLEPVWPTLRPATLPLGRPADTSATLTAVTGRAATAVAAVAGVPVGTPAPVIAVPVGTPAPVIPPVVSPVVSRVLAAVAVRSVVAPVAVRSLVPGSLVALPLDAWLVLAPTLVAVAAGGPALVILPPAVFAAVPVIASRLAVPPRSGASILPASLVAGLAATISVAAVALPVPSRLAH